ncbi:hypothetical protein PoB_007118000 [Plakobranchus ocellatus]|uniref:Uncharacterized protein n=1 Tax=Plakobranchus ocellatus TaxID=259542 RepID=A0AAV4DL19_9GAST|nr:hypothetical protein PoB_007118000 [Plakobranchus ocellatus]
MRYKPAATEAISASEVLRHVPLALLTRETRACAPACFACAHRPGFLPAPDRPRARRVMTTVAKIVELILQLTYCYPYVLFFAGISTCL